ncbi:sensor domain-containing diguanylate cyclase [Psychrosphaera aestuarii]|uniref:sensor domain-containing diguanylate cyclase n=1 Tax=Psychrosphaera aestuarii TaxID=1266052 RepID=UPI001FD1CF61|nr:diguanylate cyclase [Psychrosphaera aestuarii]
MVIFSGVSIAKSTPLNTKLELVNSELFMLEDPKRFMNVDDAFAKFKRGDFVKNDDNRVSFGFTNSIVWAVLPVTNSTDKVKPLVVKIDNAWLDEIDVFFYEQSVLTKSVQLGDTSSFIDRERQKRMPSVVYTFKPGVTNILFRFKSADPMTIPVYLGDTDSVDKFEQQNAYFYGALYGALIILLIYNLVLYAYSKELRYSLYSFYLFSFTAFNFTYTGHGFWLLWPTDVLKQQWLMPLLMFIYICSGVLFTIEYLQIKKYLPRLYSYRHLIYGSLATVGCIILFVGSVSFAVMVQLVILSTMAIWMLVIGYYSYKNGNPLAKFFVPAILIGTCGAFISSMTTWGLLPYTQWAFRGIEIGMLLEMSLLSVSFGFNFKVAYDARLTAEHYARIDPLTSLYNRRALNELVYPVWKLGDRQQSPMSILLIDLDWFKRINDKFGHVVGDDVLKHVARALKKRLRVSDIILRWGGEEFLVFLPDTDLAQAKSVAEQMRRYFDENNVNDFSKITISVGVASGTANKTSFDELVKLADESLYQAKKTGRNQVVSIDELSPEVS